jgi:tetratricopeptide (TPR) repeat protein
MKLASVSAAVVLSFSLLLPAPAVLAQPAQQGDDTGSAVSEKEAKEQARQARIEEYLRKREERRAQRAREREREQEEQMAGQEPVDLSTFAEEASGATMSPVEGAVELPPRMARVQEIVRTGPLGRDPSVQRYLALIDRAEASPHQLAAFGNFLESNGWPEGAIVYYEVALSLADDDPVLWLNAGTLYRKLGEPKTAVDAYVKTLRLDPNNARAHYNLGAVFDEQGKYQDALEEYKIALLLDPSLGDPATNPQVAHNERLLAVKLMLYQEQKGSTGLPLAEVPGGGLDDGTLPARGGER